MPTYWYTQVISDRILGLAGCCSCCLLSFDPTRLKQYVNSRFCHSFSIGWPTDKLDLMYMCFLLFRELVAFKERMLCSLTKIAEDRDYCVRLCILFREPKVVRIPKVSAHASGWLYGSVQILSLSKTDSLGTGSNCLSHREVSVF